MKISTALDFAHALCLPHLAASDKYYFITTEGEVLCPRCAHNNRALIMNAILFRADDGWLVTDVLSGDNAEDNTTSCFICDADFI